MNKTLMAAILTTAALLSAGCSAQGGAAPSSPPVAAEDAQARYVQCLNEAGLAIEDLGNGAFQQDIGGDSPDAEAQAEAALRCAEESGLGAGEIPSGQDAAKADDELLALTRCLRENGLDIADPAPGAGLAIDQSEDPAKVAVALDTCQSLLGSAGATASPIPGSSR